MSSAILISITFFLIVGKSTISCLAKNNVTFDCSPRERNALLRFKRRLFYSSNMLPSWMTDNCCTWQGVECDKVTGHVIRLHLGDTELSGNKIDPSLLELKYLRYLDLSFNDFYGSSIPMFFGSMKQLQHLNLSNANFAGIVPRQLGNLSSLLALDLGDGTHRSGNLVVDDLMWATKLSSLEYLDMSNVNLTGTNDLVKVLIMLPSIIELRVSKSGLDNTNLAHTCVNSTLLANAQHLDLSSNSFEGNCPCFLHNMVSLISLDLSNNHYNFSDPHFLSSKNLAHLNLESNSLHHNAGWISDFMRDKCHLKSLNLMNNHFYGDISGAFKNLSRCLDDKLEILYLGGNEFYGQFPQWLQTQKTLVKLDLSSCSFTGTLPKWLSSLMNLNVLDLSENHIEGPIPNLASTIVDLDLSGNTMINGSIPESLCQMEGLESLDLSKNHLSGIIPDCWGNFESLTAVVLSSNKFPPEAIPSFIGGDCLLELLQLDNNNLTGELPSTLLNCNSLIVLDVRDNKLSGKLPEWIGNLPYLAAISLRSNKFYGPIPSTYCQPPHLQIMDLANNMLSRNIPRCFGNLLGMVEGGSPAASELLDVISLREGTKGAMLEYTKTLQYLVNLDLSSNHLVGEIPSELTNLTGLIGLNLSHNHLMGEIPVMIIMIKRLESFDLSNNNLFGSIPWTLSELTSLSFLNLSNNNLSGEIPPRLRSDHSSYDGNSDLCGDPLWRKCLYSDAKGMNKHVKIILGVLSAIVVLSLCTTFFILRKLQQGKREAELHQLLTLDGYTEDDNGRGSTNHDLRPFTYSSIKSATHSFSSVNKLGQGGFGPVYKGKTSEGKDIAVKILSRQSGQGLLEFKTELILISKLQHVNLVKLIGFCVHKDDKMIIYDYMPNKSLDFFLFSPSNGGKLDWQKRFNIIEGIAQGLLYLHKYSRLKIIHRDLKPSNILLDQNMIPKISDFGLARIFKQDISEANTHRRVGTLGYMAPEYAMQGIFSVKSDVYSFGVLVLEIVSGRKNNSFHDIEGPLSLVEYAWELWKKEHVLELINPALRDSCVIDQLQRCIHIGLLCVENHAVDRPTSEDVVLMLKNEMTNLPMPKCPAFITRNSVTEEVEQCVPDTISSANEITLSEIGGR